MTLSRHPSVRFLQFAIVALCALSFALPARAQKVWTGENSADWGDGGNWMGGAPVGGDSGWHNSGRQEGD